MRIAVWTSFAMLLTLLSTPAFADYYDYDKDKYDHAWVKQPDGFGLSLKGFSREMSIATLDTMRYMQNMPVAPNPSRPRQIWRNLVNNDPTQPIERFGTDLIDVEGYDRRHHKIVYPYPSVEDSLRDNPYNQLDPKARQYYKLR